MCGGPWRNTATSEDTMLNLLGPIQPYPFVLPVVIYNGERRWTAPTDIGDLLGPVPGESLGYRPRLRYVLIEIRAQDRAGAEVGRGAGTNCGCRRASSGSGKHRFSGSANWFTGWLVAGSAPAPPSSSCRCWRGSPTPKTSSPSPMR